MDDHHLGLGVNKMGKNIRKEPSNHQQNPQALVYNINKTDFRSIVQHLTGLASSSSHNSPQTSNPIPPKPLNSRLLKVRPAPLTQLTRPPLPQSVNPVQFNPSASEPVQFNPSASKPVQFNPSTSEPVQFNPSTSEPVQPFVNQFSVNPVESPISAYIRYLTEPSPAGNQSKIQNQNPVQSLTGQFPSHQTSPRLFQSPASQFAMSPPPPRSPFPLLSPNFAFSPQFSGGGEPLLPPPSPGFFFPLLSPLWRSQ